MSLTKGSAKASGTVPSSLSGGVEKIAVLDGDDMDGDTAAPFWKFVVNAWVLPDSRPIAKISEQAKTKTLCRAMMYILKYDDNWIYQYTKVRSSMVG